MEWNHTFRQGIGAFFVIGIVGLTAVTVPSDTHSAAQGKLGYSSSGSFSISLVVHPAMEAQVGTKVEDENGNFAIESIDELDFGQPTALCVTGRGLSGFSLSASGASGVNLLVGENGGAETLITGSTSEVFKINPGCSNSQRTLKAISEPEFQGSSAPIVLLIQAE